MGLKLPRLLAPALGALLLLAWSSPGFAQGNRADRLRQAAADFIGAAFTGVSELGSPDLSEAVLEPIGGGAEDLQQSLGDAVFAVPVAGNIGYVLRAQVYHDLPIVFPVEWSIVQVFVGDPSRWRVVQNGPLVVVQPGEPGARTNLTVLFASGELVQIDLEELTGAYGLFRTGRAYVGPESWLVDRIFALMPLSVRDSVIDLVVGGQLTVGSLLADPVESIRPFDVFSALPPRAVGRSLPPALVRALALADTAAPVPDPEPAEPPLVTDPLPSVPPVDEAGATADPPAAPEPSVPTPEPAEPAEPAELRPPGFVGPPLRPLDSVPPPAAPPVDQAPALVPAPAPPRPAPAPSAPAPPVVPNGDDPLRPFGGIDLGPAGAQLYPGVDGPGYFPAAFVPGSLQVAASLASAPVQAPADDVVAPVVDRFVSAPDLVELEDQLAAARASRDRARQSAGDRIADATLAIEDTLDQLRADYPARVQFSILLDPDVPPFTPPFWHLGVWHDGAHTYWRTLALAPRFVDAVSGLVLPATRLDDYVYRLDGVVDRGVFEVAGEDGRPRRLYWRRREELEGPS